MFYLKGTMMFAFRVKAKLSRERKHRMEILERLRSSEGKRDECVKRLADWDRPRCGMERHGIFSRESRTALEQNLRTCEYEVSRDAAAFDESTTRCNTLLDRLHRQPKGEVIFAFLTPFF
jgi:hypothetical protein